jgi:four helix bundle protein
LRSTGGLWLKTYLAHALGSGNEMLVHLRVAQELGYLPEKEANGLAERYNVVCRQLNKPMQRWR